MKYLLPILISAFGCALQAADEPNSVDHAGIIQSWNENDFKAGQEIYQTLCTNCHGADGVTPPLPIARAFGSGEMKFGLDPYAMFQTLTKGNGLMGPQTWMTPKERYQVILYIRETFMTEREDFFEINDGYLEELPTINVVVKESDKVERDFGPALASQLTREIPSVLTVKLDSETTISYDLHRMDQAGLWSGGFLNLVATQHYRERGGGVAEPGGKPIEGLQTWRWAHDGTFDFDEDALPPRGPMPDKWLRYDGHYLSNNGVVFSYAIDGRQIFEQPGKPAGYGAIEHLLRIEAGDELKLCVAQFDPDVTPLKGFLPSRATTFDVSDQGDVAMIGMNYKTGLEGFIAASLRGETEGLSWSFGEKNRLVLTIPASQNPREFQVLRYAGKGDASLLAFATFAGADRPLGSISEQIKGGEARWPEILTTKGRLGDEDTAYTQDVLEIPPNDAGNPYNVWFRTSSLAFFPDGRMVVSTHGGDIWIVSGIDRDLKELKWKRFAAGLYEPFGLQVIDGLIYVTCKDRLTRLHDLNNDGEADFYESFSADDDVSVNFHAFNFDLQRDAEGNLFYAKSGQYTDYKLPGAIIKVSPDGSKREVYATGLRTPNGMGMTPDGRPTVSDNQGSWMPASKVSVVEPGGFYGYVQTFATAQWAPDGGKIDHTKVVPPNTFDQPVIWMPQHFDNSSGGQLWVDDERWGPLAGRMLHTSFGKGWLYYMMQQNVDGVEQAAIAKLKLDAETGIQRARVNPADGQVYAVGLNGWNGNGRKGLSQGGISRFRYTGKESKLLTNVQVTEEGIRLEFNFALSPEAATEVGRYQLKQWNYLWASKYGSAQYSLKNEWETGVDDVVIEEIVPDDDLKSVLLKIPDIQPVNQVELNLDLIGADGGKFNDQAYMTINAVPGGKHPTMKELTKERVFMWEKIKREEEERKRKKAEQRKKAQQNKEK